MNLSHHGGSCGHSCCLRVENMSVKIGTDCILKDVNLHLSDIPSTAAFSHY